MSEEQRRDAVSSSAAIPSQHTTPPPSARRERHEVLLDTPRNPSPRKRTYSNAEEEERERRQLQAEFETLQVEIGMLEDDHRRAKAGRQDDGIIEKDAFETGASKVGRGISMVDVAEDEEELESLEAMLRQMDDGALAALLTANTTAPAIEEALMQLLPKDKPPTVLAPALSAGIEGTGSGHQIDEEETLIAQATNEALDEQLEAALLGRKERSEELAKALTHFTGLELETVTSSDPIRNERNQKNSLRRISMQGSLQGDLGLIVVDLDVEDREDEKKNVMPQIIALDVEVDDAIFFALGSEQIKSFVENVDLPALLLSIRTLTPLAIARFRLFTSVARLFPALAAEQNRVWRESGVELSHRPRANVQDVRRRQPSRNTETLPPLSLLVEPNIMEKLTLQSDQGVKLTFRFVISFTRWGLASAALSAAPEVPTHFVQSAKTEKTLFEFADRFTHLCAHRPRYADMRTVMVETINAFFNL